MKVHFDNRENFKGVILGHKESIQFPIFIEDKPYERVPLEKRLEGRNLKLITLGEKFKYTLYNINIMGIKESDNSKLLEGDYALVGLIYKDIGKEEMLNLIKKNIDDRRVKEMGKFICHENLKEIYEIKQGMITNHLLHSSIERTRESFEAEAKRYRESSNSWKEIGWTEDSDENPICPLGGEYIIGNFNENPSCTICGQLKE